ncbi:hypothetical protein F511_42142 [Dorcoceras hygrometricum]|uniref:Uncharacterized protein n=1 Tax=Dorcoceras hygrometricum TaxID=472368 RepID=A0A2Z7C7E4_9LAMI|nr:hypothetical protein F511_42142 [Dorcoceras hygrometricum]
MKNQKENVTNKSSDFLSPISSHVLVTEPRSRIKKISSRAFSRVKRFSALLLKTGGAIPLVLEHLKITRAPETDLDICKHPPTQAALVWTPRLYQPSAVHLELVLHLCSKTTYTELNVIVLGRDLFAFGF